MQNIWSRAAQTSCTCRCPSCAFTKAAVAQRAATTGRGQFIKPVFQSATFTYSAIIAGAVVVDGALKQDKRRKLDKAITEAKAQLDHNVPVKTSEARPGSFADRVVEPNLDEVKNGEPAASFSRSWEDEVPKDDLFPIDEQSKKEILDSISWSDTHSYDVEGARRSFWPTNLGPPVSFNQLPPQSLWARRAAADTAASRLWTSRKLRLLELAVGNFILDTLLRNEISATGYRSLWADRQNDKVDFEQLPSSLRAWAALSEYQLRGTAASLSKARWEIQSAKEDDWEAVYRRQIGFIPQLRFGMPRYSQDAEGNFRETQRQLNNSLHRTFHKVMKAARASNEPSVAGNVYRDLVMTICHDLLCSNAPPTFETVNILLVGFTKLRDHWSVEKVRRWVPFAHIRPNERTCVAILNHYTLTGNIEQFTQFIRTLRGANGGLMLARPDLTINAVNSPRLAEHPNSETRKLVQKAYPNPLVLNAIIIGLLKFVGFEKSLGIVANFQADGWGLDRAGLTLFLRDCVKAADWKNGVKIWQQLKHLSKNNQLDNSQYATMLRLCLVCNKENEYRAIYHDATSGVINTGQLHHLILAPDLHATSQPVNEKALANQASRWSDLPVVRLQNTRPIDPIPSIISRSLNLASSDTQIEIDNGLVSNAATYEKPTVMLDAEDSLLRHEAEAKETQSHQVSWQPA